MHSLLRHNIKLTVLWTHCQLLFSSEEQYKSVTYLEPALFLKQFFTNNSFYYYVQSSSFEQRINKQRKSQKYLFVNTVY